MARTRTTPPSGAPSPFASAKSTPPVCEVGRIAIALLHEVWRSYKLLDADQAHLDHTMEIVERALFGMEALS